MSKKVSLLGKKVINIRLLTKKELELQGWEDERVFALVLEGGYVLYPSCDEEGNGPGSVFINGPNEDEHYYLSPEMK